MMKLLHRKSNTCSGGGKRRTTPRRLNKLAWSSTSTCTSTCTCTSSSLGTGCFSQSQRDDGSVQVKVKEFTMSTTSPSSSTCTSSASSATQSAAVPEAATPLLSLVANTEHEHENENEHEHEQPVFFRHAASFLRVADLQQHKDNDSLALGDSSHSCQSIRNSRGRLIPHFHHSSVEAPPGLLSSDDDFSSSDEHQHELWVALDDGGGCQRMHTPVAPAAVAALAKFGLATALDRDMWKPADRHSTKLQLQTHTQTEEATATATATVRSSSWHGDTFTPSGPCPPGTLPAEADNDAVLVWSGRFRHSHYGSDLPCVRAAATINMSAQELFRLLMDSARVREYNAMSLGRQDLLVLQDGMDEEGGGVFGGITKVARALTRPPLVRKTLQFTTLLHGRKLATDDPDGAAAGADDDGGDDDDGDDEKRDGDATAPSYLLVSRAVTWNDNTSSSTNGGTTLSSSSSSVLVSEILMGVNVIRPIRGKEDSQCLFVSVNHIRSPMVPMIIAKRIGLQAAVNFVGDLRRCCCEQ